MFKLRCKPEACICTDELFDKKTEKKSNRLNIIFKRVGIPVTNTARKKYEINIETDLTFYFFSSLVGICSKHYFKKIEIYKQ